MSALPSASAEHASPSPPSQRTESPLPSRPAREADTWKAGCMHTCRAIASEVKAFCDGDGPAQQNSARNEMYQHEEASGSVVRAADLRGRNPGRDGKQGHRLQQGPTALMAVCMHLRYKSPGANGRTERFGPREGHATNRAGLGDCLE
eukprot:5052262-Pleurochrysis_carterae.AAC.1